ncbi:ribonucleotide reductase [Pseudorhodoplanes sp.]|uniref:TSCPD domain-containing protein n=1 Tax=Pseudorhodoplanes sp. TaxID=1934341 RepID=UPI00391A4284
MNRARLPDRRPNLTAAVEHAGRSYAVTIGFHPDGRAGEVFTHGAKAGSEIDFLLDDACVAISLLLQLGADPSALAASMGRLGDGSSPASIIGALADLLAQESRT